jgi:aminomethyltransferase
MEMDARIGVSLSVPSSVNETDMSDTELNDSDIDAADALLPLDAWHRARGARMVSFAGYVMPIQYEGIMAEHLWTREHAGLFDVSHMGQLLFSGEDADKALESLLPGDIIGLKQGQQRYSLLLGSDGGILDDLMVTRREDGLYMVVNGATKWDDIAHLREFLPDEITINHMEEQALLALQGPKAAAALATLVAGVDALSFMQAGAFRWRTHDLWISRSGYTGEDGFEISLPAEAASAFADELCAIDTVMPIGLGARDSLRLEAGLPLYGHDLDENIDPVTAGLSFAISKRRRTEGGFPGAARILGLLHDGAPVRRVGLALEGRLPAREGAKVCVGTQEIGSVTSGGFAPSLNAPIAMAYVPAAYAAPGTQLEIEVRGKRLPATVTPLPFVPHNYHRQGA